MAKKKALQKKLEELEKSKAALEAELQRALEENENHRLDTKSQIDELCKDRYFCGVVLTKEHVVDIIKVALSSNADIKINYDLYEMEEKIIEEVEDGTE